MKKHFQDLFKRWIDEIEKYTDPHGGLG
jgi:hypothetical protein